MEAIKNTLEVIAILIWIGIAFFAAYKLRKISKRINASLDALDEEIKNGR